MGLRCLLGHDFSEPETERERNEEGNEVVVTVREVKTCHRCGEKQIVSENKEIKSIDQLRESATGSAPGPATSEPSTGADEWSIDEWESDEPVGATDVDERAGTTGVDDPGRTADVDEAKGTEQSTDSADQWSTEELEVGGESADAASSEPDETDESDDIDQGVAEIIESAEMEDEMLQTDSAGEEAVENAETPVHPGQRSTDEAAEHDVSGEDAEILDDGSPPEEGREQWDEQADPEQVPGQDSADSDPDTQEDEDAFIMGEEKPAGDESAAEESAPEADETEPSAPADDKPTAVESEDAVILDDEVGRSTEAGEQTDGPAQSDPEDAVESEGDDIVDESTEESGPTPWPETAGEDEGHDATEPDGEPADVEFGGGITPEQPRNEENGSQAGASPAEPVGESEPAPDAGSGEGENSDSERSPQPTINLEQSTREAQLEYYCAECGLTREVGNSSMRAGDICPECRKGYIEEQERSA